MNAVAYFDDRTIFARAMDLHLIEHRFDFLICDGSSGK